MILSKILLLLVEGETENFVFGGGRSLRYHVFIFCMYYSDVYRNGMHSTFSGIPLKSQYIYRKVNRGSVSTKFVTSPGFLHK